MLKWGMHMYVYMCVFVEARGQFQVSSSATMTTLFLSLAQLLWLDSGLQESSISSSPALGFRLLLPHPAFYKGSRDQTQVLKLVPYFVN